MADGNSFKPYVHQVAGHKGLTGLLSSNDGFVLKPVQQPPKGERERKFYEWLFKSKDSTEEILELRRFLPEYFGTVELKHYPVANSRHYLKLEDITRNFRFPCILDVKIGRVTWDDTADQEKINSRKRKWPLQTSLGFGILGFRVYNHTSGTHESIDKYKCKSLATTQEVDQVFAAYLRGAANDDKKAAVTEKIISRLLDIKKHFEKQRILKFIASSLLIVYEGDHISCHHICQHTVGKLAGECLTPKTLCDSCQDIEVRMIDMAHVFECSEMDENYILGINNLILHFERQMEH